MRLVLMITLAATCLVPVSAAAASEKISLSFVEAPLIDVIAALEDLTGSRIEVTPTPAPTDIVTARMSDVTVADALTQILRVHAHSWRFSGTSLTAFGLDASDGGLVLSTVEPGSVAERAGLKAGDVVTSINGRAIASRRDALMALGEGRRPLNVTVRRATSEVRLRLDP